MITKFEPHREIFPVQTILFFVFRKYANSLIHFSLNLIAESLIVIYAFLCAPSVHSDSHTDECIKNTDGRRLVLCHIEELSVKNARLGRIFHDLLQPVIIKFLLCHFFKETDQLFELKDAVFNDFFSRLLVHHIFRCVKNKNRRTAFS